MHSRNLYIEKSISMCNNPVTYLYKSNEEFKIDT